MKRRNLVLTLLALALVLSAGIGSAMAYFTTYATAKGGMPVSMSEETVEWLSQWTKHIKVRNDGDEPVFVRARALGSAQYTLRYTGGTDWSYARDENGVTWWYYGPALAKGEETTELDVLIDNVPAELKDSASFNIVVYTESTRAIYGEDGTATADWNAVLDSEREGVN